MRLTGRLLRRIPSGNVGGFETRLGTWNFGWFTFRLRTRRC